MIARRALTVLAASAFLAVPAMPAAAHVSGGPEPSNYASVITSVSRELPGVEITLSADGSLIRVTNTGPGALSVPGYSEEPYLTIGPEEVRRNIHSPATYLNVSPAGDVELPPEADPSASPSWQSVAATPTYEWHDHRTHWMGDDLPPAVAADPGSVHLIAEWSVPLVYDGVEVFVEGTLTWYPPPSSLPAILVIVGLLVLALAAAGRSDGPRLLVGLLGLAVVAEAVHLATSPLPVESVVYGVAASALPLLVAAALTLLAWRSARSGTATVVYAAGIAAWLLLLQGLSDVTALWNSQLLSAGPAWLTRACVLLTVGLGLGVALGTLRVLARGRTAAVPASR